MNMTPIRPPDGDDHRPSEPDEKPTSDFGPAQWFWVIAIAVVLLGPLAIWLYRLALGL